MTGSRSTFSQTVSLRLPPSRHRRNVCYSSSPLARKVTNTRGAFASFATEGTGFSELFPGIKPHLLTLGEFSAGSKCHASRHRLIPESNFKIPFYRDVLMALGVASVSKQACKNILSQGPGSAITIVVGGATESLSAHPGTADLTLKKRFGFVKIAIREGADLVPVFSFGENDVSAWRVSE